MLTKILCLLLLHSFIQFIVTDAISFEEDTAITAKEAKTLVKFRELVRRKLPHKYMEESIFLIKWLRARDFDMSAAQEMLLKHIKWRAENQIDKIDYEHWDDFEEDFPWNMHGVDKEGRPLVQIVLKDWDIRQAVVSGRRKRLIRWVYKYFEDASKRVRKLQNEGKNITRFAIIMDAEGFNPVNHGCPLCIPIYLTIANAFEEQYPGSVDKIHVTNTPEYFRVILRLVWPILSKDTRKALKTHGPNRDTWTKVLSKGIDKNQLLPAFGGTLRDE